MALGIKLFCECKICKKEFVSFSTGKSTMHDTWQSVIDEMSRDMFKAHASVSPDCKVREDDIFVRDVKRTPD